MADGTGAVTQGEDQGLKLLGQGLNLLGGVLQTAATPKPVSVGPNAGPPPTNEKQTANAPQAAVPNWVWWAGGGVAVLVLVWAVSK